MASKGATQLSPLQAATKARPAQIAPKRLAPVHARVYTIAAGARLPTCKEFL